MNRVRMLIIAFVALALSGVVTFMAYRLLSSRLAPSPAQTTPVVVAVEKIGLGARIGPAQVRTVAWPKALRPEGTFSDPQAVVGRGVIVPLLTNEPVIEEKLAPREAGAGLTSAIPEGMRAVAVKVNDVIGVAGFVLPGTRVDVILTGSPDRSGQDDTSKVILENVQVLAAGPNLQQDEDGKPQNVQVITLLLQPEDTQKLALASADGRIQLALRNPLDLVQANPKPSLKKALYSSGSSMPEAEPASPPRPAVKKKVAAAPPPPKPVVAATPPPEKQVEVELIYGTERKKVLFNEESQSWDKDQKTKDQRPK